MRRIVSCFALLLCISCLALQAQAEEPVSVSKVLDGDTAILSDGSRIRLASVDTPELNSHTGKSQYFASQAKQFLADKIEGKMITVTKVVTTDRYGRKIVLAEDEHGDLGRALVRNGYAFVYPHGREASRYLKTLLPLQREAIQNRRGMWKKLSDYLMQSGKVVGNKRSKRFFSRTCSGVETIAKRNKVTFNSALEAFISGYAPVRKCKILPETDDILAK